MKRLIIWLDDLRDPYNDIWKKYIFDSLNVSNPLDAILNYKIIWAKNSSEFKDIWNQNRDIAYAIFFDNDLGEHIEGYDLLSNIVEKDIVERDMDRIHLFAQTSNTSAKNKMNLAFRSLDRFWDNQ
jgi:hypothetical protein